MSPGQKLEKGIAVEEKCNTVTFVGADGMEQSFPLDFLLERGAIVANRVNGEDIMSVMGATNQLWVPGLPAKYFVRDIREIRFTNEEVPPVIGPFVDDGHDYTNRPNVAAKAEYVGRVGEPLEFSGLGPRFRQAHHRGGVLARQRRALDPLRSGGHNGRALGVVDLRLHA